MKVTNSKQLSAFLKDTRLNMKLPQAKVASSVGIRQDTVSSFEKNPDSTKVDTLFKILSALNLELDIKVRGTEPESQRMDDDVKATETQWKEEW
ncbi:helix-turn-helix domain-containing protein [Shewanella sp. 1_MG-2023]|uniref:helix-turn-helix domain-containing protein n=1 Tax=unclassified Shewanella TaxID=196818 RepID=UPI0026E27DC4|nr:MULTISPECIES: helix-turn-helix domain-containing protein [unclassified Shewanella]MDO6612977.1 helix-turn-helix domain-containing protein [Shewanella sp. 7_MG-2023]MDO6772843.1 helix-turn-helix domain-containing protein [Shewanella sp. 2_MG-2023]MDO6795109.1 helix-turn-helix domain-containing protein [Shewanella sp. 1_MG-2023]